MSTLDDIVNIAITSQTAQIKQPGFGVPIIIDAHSRFSELVRYYNAPGDMLGDGFTTSDAAYLAAVKLCAQTPRPPRFAVGRRASKPTLKIEITPTAISNQAFTVEVAGVAKTFTSGAAATAAQIATGLMGAIGAVPGFTVTDTGAKVTITGAAPGNWLRVKAANPALLAVEQTHADPGIVADLAAISLENSDWYAAMITTASKAEIVAAAGWFESNKRLLIQASQDSAIITAAATGASDVAKTLQTSAYFRTAIMYHPDNGAFADAGWLGSCLPFNPGSETWKFKTLAGVPGVTLTPTQLINLKDKSANYYTEFGGRNITGEGTAASGEFIDTVRGRDWLEARLQTRVFFVLANNPKVPYTDAGVTQIEGETRAQMSEGVDRTFLSPDPAPVVTAKRVADIPAIDRAGRVLDAITFDAVIAGAVHAVKIRGTISA